MGFRFLSTQGCRVSFGPSLHCERVFVAQIVVRAYFDGSQTAEVDCTAFCVTTILGTVQALHCTLVNIVQCTVDYCCTQTTVCIKSAKTKLGTPVLDLQSSRS